MIKQCKYKYYTINVRSSKQGVTRKNQDSATEGKSYEARMESNLGRESSSVNLLWVTLIRNFGILLTVTQLQGSLQLVSLLISLVLD